MKPLLLMMVVLFCYAQNCDARGMKSTERHDSARACNKAIEQYAKDQEAEAYEKTERIRVRRSSDDVIHIEREASTEELYCKGNIAHHFIREK